MIDRRRDEFTLNKPVNKEWSEDISGRVRELVEKKVKNKVVQGVPKLFFFLRKP